jgi:hypothetical protein
MNISVANHGLTKESRRQVASSGSGRSFPLRESYLPRIIYLDQENSLLEIHLTVFRHFRSIFTKVLELREQPAIKILLSQITQAKEKRKPWSMLEYLKKMK